MSHMENDPGHTLMFGAKGPSLVSPHATWHHLWWGYSPLFLKISCHSTASRDVLSLAPVVISDHTIGSSSEGELWIPNTDGRRMDRGWRQPGTNLAFRLTKPGAGASQSYKEPPCVERSNAYYHCSAWVCETEDTALIWEIPKPSITKISRFG